MCVGTLTTLHCEQAAVCAEGVAGDARELGCALLWGVHYGCQPAGLQGGTLQNHHAVMVQGDVARCLPVVVAACLWARASRATLLTPFLPTLPLQAPRRRMMAGCSSQCMMPPLKRETW